MWLSELHQWLIYYSQNSIEHDKSFCASPTVLIVVLDLLFQIVSQWMFVWNGTGSFYYLIYCEFYKFNSLSHFCDMKKFLYLQLARWKAKLLLVRPDRQQSNMWMWIFSSTKLSSTWKNYNPPSPFRFSLKMNLWVRFYFVELQGIN